MLEKVIPLTIASDKKELILVSIEGGWGLRRRLNDMGLHEGSRFRILHSQKPGPCIIQVKDTRLVIGLGMAHKILVREL